LLAEAEAPISRREIAERIGWDYMTSVRALDELVAQELAVVAEKTAPRRYQLLGAPRFVAADTLTPPSALTPSTATLTPAGRARAHASGNGSQGLTGRQAR